MAKLNKEDYVLSKKDLPQSELNTPPVGFKFPEGIDITKKQPTLAELEKLKNWRAGINEGLTSALTFGLAPYIGRATGLVAPDTRKPEEITPEEKSGKNIGDIAGNIMFAGATGGVGGALGPVQKASGTLLKLVPSSMLRGYLGGAVLGALRTPESAQKSGKIADMLDLESRGESAAWGGVFGSAFAGLNKLMGNYTTWLKNKKWAGGDLATSEAERKIIQDRAHKMMNAEYKFYGKSLDKIDTLSKTAKNPPNVNNKELFDEVQSELMEKSAALKTMLKNNKLAVGKGDALIMDISKSELSYRDARDILTKLQNDPAVSLVMKKVRKGGFGTLNNAQRDIFFFVDGFRKNLNEAAAKSSKEIAQITKTMNSRYGKVADAYKSIYPLISDDAVHAMGSGSITGMGSNPKPRMMIRAKTLFTPQQLADMEAYRQFIANKQQLVGSGEGKATAGAAAAAAAPIGAYKLLNWWNGPKQEKR